jgi:hypothetical protein
MFCSNESSSLASASGTSKPTHFPNAPSQRSKYSSAVRRLFPAIASMTSAVWHGWMKNTGLFVAGCSFIASFGRSPCGRQSRTYRYSDTAEYTNAFCLSLVLWRDQVLFEGCHGWRISLLCI